MKKSTRSRLTEKQIAVFPGNTLFDKIDRAVCRAGNLPGKELFEAWEVARRVRRKFRGGRVVDAPGDNLLAEFGSVVDATECAVKIQQELKTQNAELPENRRMDFRIGINLGDVVEEVGRIYGDGVNI